MRADRADPVTNGTEAFFGSFFQKRIASFLRRDRMQLACPRIER
jgi:hypothetical protein